MVDMKPDRKGDKMSEAEQERLTAPDVENLADADSLPGVIAELGNLGSGAVVTQEGISRLFGRCETSVKRAIQRGELPAPTRLFGQNTWTVGALIRHIEERLAHAAREDQELKQKVRRLSP